MLTSNGERGAAQACAATPSATSKAVTPRIASSATSSRLVARVLRVEWLGQTVASLCWIASVLAYGINSSGDWLQLCAASAWLVANIASVVTAEAD